MLLGQRLAFATESAGMLQEPAMFIDDFPAFTEPPPPQFGRTDPARARAPHIPAVAGEARSVTFSYPGSERVALRDVSLHIEPGEVVALVGANGSGETTLGQAVGRAVPA